MTAAPVSLAPAATDEPAFDVVLVVERDDAEALRELGLEAAALREPGWRDRLRPGGSALLIGPAARLAGDLRKLGVAEAFWAELPLPSRYVAEFFSDASKRAGRILRPDEARELWRLVTDRALSVEAAPNFSGHSALAARPKRQAVCESFDELEQLPPPAWLVDGLLPAVGVALIASPPNVGKSTVAVDLMMRCATGQAWHGRSVQAGVALYCAGEGKPGLVARRKAWRSQHDAQAVHTHRLVTKLPPLSTSAGQAELEGLVAEHKPRLVVLDTVSALWGGESEDDASVVAPFLAFLQRQAEAAGCLFLCVHHERKPSAQPQAGNAWAAVRGSGAWVGSADAVLSLSGPPDDLRLTVTKQRDGERLAPIPLRLVAVDLPNGGSSVVVVPGAEAPPAAEHEPRAEDAILATMRLVGADGITLPGAMQAGGCAKSTAWRALSLLVSNGLAEQFGRRGSIRWRAR